jgi:hypothetical protein
LASSDTIACSGSDAAIAPARVLAVIGPGVRVGQDGHRGARGHQVAGAARVGEERDRGPGSGQDEVIVSGELGFGAFGQVGEPADGGEAGTGLHPRRKRLGQQLRSGRGADPAGRREPALGQRRPAEQEHRGRGGGAGG